MAHGKEILFLIVKPGLGLIGYFKRFLIRALVLKLEVCFLTIKMTNYSWIIGLNKSL